MKRSSSLFIFLVAAGVSLLAAQASAGDLTAGRATVEGVCQTCHGIDGVATLPMAANLSGQQKLYMMAQLEAYRAGTRQHEQMSLIAQMLSDEDIENVSEWYSSIKITIEMPE